jgi:hypothetical protein
MKVILETIITLAENDKLESVLARTDKLPTNAVSEPEYLSFVIDTDEIFDIAKSQGIEGANTAIDKVLANYGNEIKSKLSKTINK